MQINIIAWEQVNGLSQEELLLIKQLEQTESTQEEQLKQKIFTAPLKLQKRNPDFEQLEQIQLHYKLKFDKLSEVSKNLEGICTQLKQLNEDKENIVENISTFHKEASLYIDEQKNLLEYSYQIQEHLQYYTNIQKIQSELETTDVQDINFQALISEIQDGIIFFQSRPNYYNSEKCINSYVQLKKKLLSICKSLLFKLLNKESQFINSKFSYLKDILCVFYPTIFGAQMEQANPLKLQLLQIIFPQFMSMFIIQDNKTKFVQLYNDDLNKFHINDSVHDFFNYLQSQLTKDQDLLNLYNDTFSQYNSYNRINLHQQINQIISKQSQNIQQTGSILGKIKQSLTNEIITYEQNECLIFETMINLIFEITIIESQYSMFYFRTNEKIILENDRQLLIKIIENYYQAIRIFIQKIFNLDQLVIMNETTQQLKAYVIQLANNYTQFNDEIFKNSYIHQIYKYLSEINKQHNQQDQLHLSTFIDVFQSQFIDKIIFDLMHKSIQSSQIQIQQKIYQFQPKEYIRNKGKLIIHKYIEQKQHQHRGYELQRNEIYPSVQFGLEIIKKMQKSVDQKIFKQLAGEILREINTQLKLVAEQYEVKFDSYLFYLKNIILLCDELTQLDGNYVVKESELDFSETKAILLSLITGQLRPEIKWVELTSPEKLWTYITNFFQFMYKGMPKLNQYEVDWKDNLMNQKNMILFQFVKDMTFIVAKQLIQFIRNYQYLIHKLEQEVKEEQAQNDFNQLISNNSIKRTYQLFYENIIDFIQEIVLKLNNYLNRSTFHQIEVFLNEIISNSFTLLNQFYIIVSKHYGSEEYESFNFNSTETILNSLKIEYQD